ncbi:membrane-bound lytic murein transglycosylase MltF [Desulfotignum phosphitoxidans]|jgi:membrane-bound lytic murein transglycosylase F|uniref:Membrane-bound lytic murein transglycosylase F n=1 Tax=Desulfotignum phosphitoxidans DSM 13687 TaxID=1286635 RepID=S0FW90_9BACT|nr:membrane-bound lytic murein transglycosylase MltF [Desulfotignum phosphitoxidans]EMS79323.1 membrane-bound lytic murein transglycosylase F [Desulfotignum phosphitoxidans DSM 13687]
MKSFYLKHFIFLTLLILCGYFVYLSYLLQHRDLKHISGTLERIQKSGVLRLITTRSLNNYYLYKGEPTGFEYDLAREFARYLHVDLDVVTPGWNNLVVYLDQGKGDFVGASMTVTRERLEKVKFSIPYMEVQQQVIHHALVFSPKDIEDLALRTIHVRRDTSYHYRLKEIQASGIDVRYVLYDNVPTEDLIAMVRDREIKFTIADSNIARLNQRHMPDIRVSIPIHKKESVAWAVRKDDPEMLEEINRFFLHARESGILQKIVNKYYGHPKEFDVSELKTFHKRVQKYLPKYQEIIETQSRKYGFDWRLVAAVVYQESRFDPGAKSITQVRGLMQVTEAAAREMGIQDRRDPAQSVKAGIKYLKQMYDRFEEIEDQYQRLLFALASYNVGLGHVLDAMKIAEEKGLDPQIWNSIKKTLPLLSKPDVYKKTKHGYARGWEPVQYVDRILTWYDILKQMDFS